MDPRLYVPQELSPAEKSAGSAVYRTLHDPQAVLDNRISYQELSDASIGRLVKELLQEDPTLAQRDDYMVWDETLVRIEKNGLDSLLAVLLYNFRRNQSFIVFPGEPENAVSMENGKRGIKVEFLDEMGKVMLRKTLRSAGYTGRHVVWPDDVPMTREISAQIG